MNALLEKISSYNIFNYLFPGVVFAVVADTLTTFSFIQEDIILGLFYITSLVLLLAD